MTGAPVSGPRRGHPCALIVGLSVAVVLIVLDQLTKELAEATLTRGQFVELLGPSIGFELIYNPGGAFGFAAPSVVFLVVTVLVVGLVATSLPRTASLAAALGYGMLLAGALGNAIDRVFRAGSPEGSFGGGYVVDFVAWGTFPRFNVADSAITVGFVVLAIAVLAEERRERRREQDAAVLDHAQEPDAERRDSPGPDVEARARGEVQGPDPDVDERRDPSDGAP